MSTAFAVIPTQPVRSGNGRSAGWLALTAALTVIWALPLGFIAATAPKMGEIFREFGTKMSASQYAALQLGSLLGSPVGIAVCLFALPAGCLAAGALALPPVGPATGARRWPFVVLLVVGSIAGAALLWAIYTGILSEPMLRMVQTLRASQP